MTVGRGAAPRLDPSLRPTALGICAFSVSVRALALLVPGLADVRWLVVQTGAGVVLYLAYAASFLLPRRESAAFILAYGVEWTLWGISMVLAVGARPGFHALSLYLLMMLPLLFGRLSTAARIALSVVALVAYLPLVLMLSPEVPVLRLAEPTIRWLSATNQVAAAAVVLVIASLAIRNQARARREAEEREATQAQLVEDLSHELRTPLATVLAASQAAQSPRRTPDEVQHITGRIERTARSMGRLVERLLDLAALDRDRVDAEPDTAVGEVVAQAVDDVLSLAEPRGVQVQLEPAPTDRRANAASLGVVVRNLLTNAVHHSPDGGRVAVRVIPGGEGVAIEVEDHGNGIAPGDLPRIFDRLWRADTSRSRAAGRHGLGLALARRHADLLGAELEVRSELGRGTTMVVRLD